MTSDGASGGRGEKQIPSLRYGMTIREVLWNDNQGGAVE
jgi:hypothetical protein